MILKTAAGAVADWCKPRASGDDPYLTSTTKNVEV